MTSLQCLLLTPYYYHSWSKLHCALTPLRSHFRSVNTDDMSHPKALAMANIFWNSAHLSMHSNSEALHFYLKVWGRNAWNRKGLMKNNSLVQMRPIFYCFLPAGDWKRELIRANELPQSVQLALMLLEKYRSSSKFTL